MSHFTIYQVAIGDLNPQLLKEAVAFFAEQIGAQVFYDVNEDRRYSYGGEKVIVGFKASDLPHGISFKLDSKGNLQICGDSYNQEAAYEKYKKFAASGAITNSFIVAQRAAQQNNCVNIGVEEDRIVMVVEA